MGWQSELLTEFDRDFQNGAVTSFAIFATECRQDRAMPRDTGKLAAGLKVQGARVAGGTATAEVVSTARSEDGADYGTIIDRATGKTIRPKRKKALASTRTGWGPYASATQSTKHVGWFDKVTSQETFDRSIQRGMTPFDL